MQVEQRVAGGTLGDMYLGPVIWPGLKGRKKAIDSSMAFTVSVLAEGEFELGSAAAIDPNPLLFPAPTLSFCTGGTADLTDKTSAAQRTRCRAHAVVLVVGFAAERAVGAGVVVLGDVSIRGTVAVNSEFGAAAAIDPDITSLPSPSLTLCAR